MGFSGPKIKQLFGDRTLRMAAGFPSNFHGRMRDGESSRNLPAEDAPAVAKALWRGEPAAAAMARQGKGNHGRERTQRAQNWRSRDQRKVAKTPGRKADLLTSPARSGSLVIARRFRKCMCKYQELTAF